MPAQSRAQSRFMHMVENAKRGQTSMSHLSPKAQESAKGMSFESLRHYTKTKHKGLPEHVKKAIVTSDDIKAPKKHTGIELEDFKSKNHDDKDKLHPKSPTVSQEHVKTSKAAKTPDFKRLNRKDSPVEFLHKMTQTGHNKGDKEPEVMKQHKKANVMTPEIIAMLDKVFTNPTTHRSLSPKLLSTLGRKKPTYLNTKLPMSQIKTSKEAYIEGFVKRSFEAGLNANQTTELMKKAGFVKEAIFPIMPLLTSILGGFGGEALGGLAERKALQIAAGNVARRNVSLDTLAGKAGTTNMAKQYLADNSAKAGTFGQFSANKSSQPGFFQNMMNKGITNTANFNNKHKWVFPTAGSMAVPAMLEPFMGSNGQQQPDQQAQQQPSMNYDQMGGV